ncbi:ABC transporter ATP-binding protein [Aquabacterium sp.]|uniref:ABC transporter ATP-binding protein n=1 Tax=Aquabacterium sp. TaxID=1872578 RepID=UPI002D0A8380|nr:sn-glycerol-3-phosphate ABC transporter ATP-binding protein UgpC [Aquabacterium sp.]HSW03915.1 sn-glycerol-3-phosphate ABC transporter ATP-binding protein UgpC [Aquabacterium sp.]
MATIELQHIFKRYPGAPTPAVDDVSFQVADGEFMVLLGPSGCGKSTTLRMVAGLESISDGRMRIGEREVNQVPAKDRDIAMVFQSYALYPHMTVAENLAFGLKRRSIDGGEIKRRVDAASDILGLTPLLQRKPFALSGGQRQRVALGRAIVREPAVFLFDEPLSNLDAALRVNTRNELVRLHHRLGATMLYVTHDQVEAMTMGQRICVMNQGRVAQIGKPLDVYRAPADAFVARFLGSPPMNILQARQVEHAGQRHVAIGSGLLPLQRWTRAALDAAGEAVLLGVRPEELTLHAPHADDRSALRGTVSAVEPLGAETLVVIDLEGADGRAADGETRTGEVMARLHRHTDVHIGDKVALSCAPNALYLFDARSEKAIPPQDAAA